MTRRCWSPPSSASWQPPRPSTLIPKPEQYTKHTARLNTIDVQYNWKSTNGARDLAPATTATQHEHNIVRYHRTNTSHCIHSCKGGYAQCMHTILCVVVPHACLRHCCARSLRPLTESTSHRGSVTTIQVQYMADLRKRCHSTCAFP
jgi:hypothetical protein